MSLILQLIWEHAKRHKKDAIILCITTILSTSVWVIEPLYTSYAIDALTGTLQGIDVDYWWIFGWWIVVFLSSSIIGGLDKYYTWHLGNLLKMDRREEVYRHLLKLDVHFHINKQSGEVISKMEDGADEMRGVFRVLVDLVPSVFSSLVFLIISFSIHWILSLILIIGIALYVIFQIAISVRIAAIQDVVNKLWAKSMGRAYDAMANIFAVKSAGREDDEYTQLRNTNLEALISQKRVNKMWAWVESINFYALIRIALIGVGTILLVRGELTLGQLYYFQYVFFRILTPFEILSNFMPNWNESVGKIKFAQSILNTTIDVDQKKDGKTLDQIHGNIELKNVSFAYGKDADTINNVSLSVQEGEKIALVGHSGAGKSTIAMLLNRFYDVSDGAITIDGVDIRDLDMYWWRRQIGLVLQENIMFNDSVLENIRYARPEATMEEVIDAAKRSSAHEFIEQLSEKYDTLIGERGIRLSGGERQRVAIARAILKKPSIVVLDEATSALDSITEKKVQEGIAELIKGRTSFIIAHRLSTVRSVDRIAVLEDGKLAACAPHEELLKISPSYKEMVELQQGGMLAE